MFTSPVAPELVIVAVNSLRPTKPAGERIGSAADIAGRERGVDAARIAADQSAGAVALTIRPIALPTVTVTSAIEFTIAPMLAPGPKIPFWPMSPPATMPLFAVPCDTVPSTVTLVTVPPFDPARMPMNWPGPVTFGFAVTLALVMLRLLTWPVAPIVPNRPTLMPKALGAMGAMVRLLMVFPRPSNRPVNGPPAPPIGRNREAGHVDVGRAERVVLASVERWCRSPAGSPACSPACTAVSVLDGPSEVAAACRCVKFVRASPIAAVGL